MTIITQSKSNVIEAYNRIKDYIHLTPIMSSKTINAKLGHEILFKVESFQKTGAFKIRGVLNHLITLKEKNALPEQVVAYSTGNHGIGLAYAAKLLNIKARVYLPKDTSTIKQQAARYYGANVIYTDTRVEAESKAKHDANYGFYYLHPSDSDSTIAGAGTLCYEALNQINAKVDAIFASCGGGGLLSGTYLAKEALDTKSHIIGSEPKVANDAFLSIKQNKIYRFSSSPPTLADGLRTLALSERTFHYIKRIDDFYLASEEEICYWTSYLMHLLKIICEPSCALNMVAVTNWLKVQTSQKRVLVLLSGGNIDSQLHQQLSKYDYSSNI